MPLKTFGANGQGYESDILRALYWAVNAGAHVINMSFSMTQYSREMQTALSYAVSQNLICVAAAGNNGTAAVVYPAGYQTVMGVGSTNLMDERSSFSNFGQDVWVAAPGENITSTYPYGTYATGSGTSFSAPFVAGAAALLVNQNANGDESSASSAIAHAKAIGQNMGNGRLDIYVALSANLNP
jgi:thermitase